MPSLAESLVVKLGKKTHTLSLQLRQKYYKKQKTQKQRTKRWFRSWKSLLQNFQRPRETHMPTNPFKQSQNQKELWEAFLLRGILKKFLKSSATKIDWHKISKAKVVTLKKTSNYEALQKKCFPLKVVSATFLLVCFVCLKESTCKTRENAFYFTSKALAVLEIINF